MIRKILRAASAMAVAVCGCAAEDTSEDVQRQILEDAEFRSGDPAFCDAVFTFEHDIETTDGAVLHVIEKFTPASVLRLPRRALLMLPGTLVTGQMYDIPVQGSDFNALDRAASAGFFAYAVTYEGYPGSSLPADGSTVTATSTLQQMGEVVEWIRDERKIWKVDLLGASFGSSLAIALGGAMSPTDPSHIGHLVLMALVYEEVTPLFESIFFSPEVQQALENAPNGYIQTSSESYGLILAAADPAAATWGFQNFPDVYATGPTLEGFDLPVFDGEYGEAPALQFWGTADPITPFEDVETFQGEYAGPNELRVLPGAGHAPYLAAPDLREAFWSETFSFLDDYPFDFYIACGPEAGSW